MLPLDLHLHLLRHVRNHQVDESADEEDNMLPKSSGLHEAHCRINCVWSLHSWDTNLKNKDKRQSDGKKVKVVRRQVSILITEAPIPAHHKSSREVLIPHRPEVVEDH